MIIKTRFLLLVLLLLGLGLGRMVSVSATPVGEQGDSGPTAASILNTHCVSCHGPSQQLSGLRLDARSSLLEGGYSGPAIIPGNSNDSALVHRLISEREGYRMPMGAPPLTGLQIDTLRTWIDRGAPWQEEASVPAKADAPSAEGQEHWSFQPVVRPAIPPLRNRSWARSPIDAFVLSRLEAEGISPSREASKEALFRRVNLDLTGLLPTRQEQNIFLLDNRPDAYEDVVDRLLASPHYGEKWARYWLDLARYADSDGYEKDLLRPHAWRWRQWVIDALNRDLPYDRFTIEQIGGDLLPDASQEQKVATGFLRSGLLNREAGVPRGQVRFEEVVDQTNTVATVWLGLTMGCAQCHDHKYDPTSQKQYYQFLAFFNEAEGREMDAPLPGDMGPYLKNLPGYREERRKLLENDQISVSRLQARWEAMLIEADEHPGKHLDWDDILRGVVLGELDRAMKLLRMGPADRSWRENDLVTSFFFRFPGPENAKDEALTERLKELGKKLEELDESFPDLSRAYVVQATPAQTHLALRGNYRSPGVVVRPATPDWLPPLEETGDPARLRLARWLVRKDHPLTARVAANRIWQELLGRGLVITSEDFGTQGERPSHPGILDWLATEFMARGWSQKQLIRMIVTSATYRQSSRARLELEEKDPENALLARQNRLRLSAELIRDAALRVSGLLDTRIGGRSIRPTQPEWVSKLTYGKNAWQESQGRDRYRRGLYVLFKRSAPYPQMLNFDAPDSSISVCRRERSNTVLQALNLLNDPVFMECARSLAIRILQEAPSTWEGRLDHAYRLCLGRLPSSRERERFRQFFTRQKEILEGEPESVQQLTSGAVLEFQPLQVASWVAAGRAILNLDEFITRE